MKNSLKLDQEEMKVLRDFERGELTSINNFKEAKRQLEEAAHGWINFRVAGQGQPWFVWVFREYGLPETVRTDNGPPFASLALGGPESVSGLVGARGDSARMDSPGHTK